MRGTRFSPDIQEFFTLLAEYSVEYVIVGGEAVIYYGFARLTGDVDIFYRGSSENVAKLYGALKDFWQENIWTSRSSHDPFFSHRSNQAKASLCIGLSNLCGPAYILARKASAAPAFA